MKRCGFSILFLALGCQAGNDAPKLGVEEAKEKLTIYTVNYPLQYFAERIGGDAVAVFFPAPPNVDPADWQPDVETLLAYQEADRILLNGAGYAKWVQRVTLPASRLVNSATAFEGDYIINEKALVHSHGPEGEHSHDQAAFTTWLDPRLAIEQARAIRDALVEARPTERDGFDAAFSALEQDLLAIDASIETLVAAGPAPALLASHPVYQYLERRYQLDLESLHFEPDQLPDPAAWESLEQILETHPARWMLWESQPMAETVRRLQEKGVTSLVFDPCAHPPLSGDFLSVMRANVARFETIFKSAASE